jgi:hypothetical protein
MNRQNLRALVVYACAAWMTLLIVKEFRSVGGPYLEIPETIFDHVLPDVQLSRQAIVMSRHAEQLMPRGASLTVIAPELAPNYDPTHYLTASGVLPRHRVQHPTLAEGEKWPDFVIALGTLPLEHRGYTLLREFPEGRLYAARR